MKKFTLFTLVLLAFVLVACGGGEGEMEVSNIWGRVSPMVAENGVFYMTITNNTGQDDTLTAVKTDACGMVELHESSMKDDGVMGMQPVEGGIIPLPDGEAVELKVGGMHVMCMNKQVEFEEGTIINLTLMFENTPEMSVEAEILTQAPE